MPPGTRAWEPALLYNCDRLILCITAGSIQCDAPA